MSGTKQQFAGKGHGLVGERQPCRQGVPCSNLGYIPASWKDSVILPIYKKDDGCNPANYKPIR